MFEISHSNKSKRYAQCALETLESDSRYSFRGKKDTHTSVIKLKKIIIIKPNAANVQQIKKKHIPNIKSHYIRGFLSMNRFGYEKKTNHFKLCAIHIEIHLKFTEISEFIFIKWVTTPSTQALCNLRNNQRNGEQSGKNHTRTFSWQQIGTIKNVIMQKCKVHFNIVRGDCYSAAVFVL